RAESRAAGAAVAAVTETAAGAARRRPALCPSGAVLALALHRALVAALRLSQGTADESAGGANGGQVNVISHHAAHHERPRLSLLRRGLASRGSRDDAARHDRDDGTAVAAGGDRRAEAHLTRRASGDRSRPDARSLANAHARAVAAPAAERHLGLSRESSAAWD